MLPVVAARTALQPYGCLFAASAPWSERSCSVQPFPDIESSGLFV